MIQSQAPRFSGQDDLLGQQMQAPNIARPRRDEAFKDIEELEKLVVIDMDSIRSEDGPKYILSAPIAVR